MGNRWILSFAFAALAAASPALSSVTSSDLGQPAPALKVAKLNEERFDLASEKGKVVMVVFFATWCEGCEKELRVVNGVFKKYRQSGLDVLALSINRSRERKEVVEFMRQFDFPGALLSDAETNDFGGPSLLPTIYVIDRGGLLRLWIKPSEKPLTAGALDDALGGLMKG